MKPWEIPSSIWYIYCSTIDRLLSHSSVNDYSRTIDLTARRLTIAIEPFRELPVLPSRALMQAIPCLSILTSASWRPTSPFVASQLCVTWPVILTSKLHITLLSGLTYSKGLKEQSVSRGHEFNASSYSRLKAIFILRVLSSPPPPLHSMMRSS